MQKPDSLRAAITAVDSELGRDPDRLKMWVEKGKIRAPMTPSRAFTYEYTLTIVVTDYPGHPSVVFLAISDWLRINQPDLLSPAATGGYSFEADILDNKTIDLQIDLPLTEQVLLTPREGGGWDLEHIAEPDPLFADDVPLHEAAPLLAEGWSQGERLA